MPRFGGSPSCARCSRAVYAAEQVVGPLGRPYHKACLACVVCARRLDSTLLVEHEGEAYCRNCHRAHLGQGKGGFGLAVPLRAEVPKAAGGTPTKNATETPPRASLEQRGSLDQQRRSVDTTRRSQDQPAPAAAPAASYTRDAPSSSGTPLCARCGKAVYFAEQLQAAGRAWHRFCLRCDGCSTTLEPGKLEEGPVEQVQKAACNVWCRTCYAKRFGPRGIGVGGISLPEHQ
ncbi:hypothetical protein FA09DRAFT_316053 [Tilletiopsis washingtonensis]|uniref:LIM zinc-binding domain-containing protein n=1 Tax=Tilletiopsis washingtonensis TaxID=58919 RepID=A0A316ZEB6_9BASI|nr:hypothetical protein FA09DRAFT_316053 [Tilletiopsis washingtonensis]PWN99636.1 hypothetical protein FA09DRAFT_316053 [Tilletiopsis washingtonensis]